MIEIRDLSVSYSTSGGLFKKKETLRAVENINLVVKKNETLGLVGESGCGKSTLGKTVIRLLKEESGDIIVDGKSITSLKGKGLLPVRRRIQAVFQDPYSSLNPRMNIYEIVSEGVRIFEKSTEADTKKRVIEVLKNVNIDADALHRFPHEFSGGQRQRIAIARALIVNPEIVVCDEAVSALDVSTQAQVINLLKDMQQQTGVGYLFISHDLNVVKYISDKVAIMYLGRIVEYGSVENITKNALHPYTKALFSSTFDLYERNKNMKPLQGEVPSIVNKPSGCHFHTRCPEVMEECRLKYPEFREYSGGHFASCHLLEK